MPKVLATPGGWCLAGPVVLWVTVLGCGNEGPSPPTASLTSSTAGGTALGSSGQPGGPATDPVHPRVQIETSLGNIELELDREKAPITVHNFLDYATSGHYRGTVFHYVESDRMILGGGFTAAGVRKPVTTAIRNEANNGLNNLRGTIAMARNFDSKDSASSNFFINLVDAPHFDHQGDTAETFGYCVFGKVVDGLEVAEKISRAPTSEQEFGRESIDAPADPVIIRDIHIVPDQ